MKNSFPDSAFREYVSNLIDADEDGYLSENEISETKAIFCYYNGITDFTGIEYFTSLVFLDICVSGLETIDLSQNKELKYLDYSGCRIQPLYMSSDNKLEYLDCSSNNITSLDLSNYTALKQLYSYIYLRLRQRLYSGIYACCRGSTAQCSDSFTVPRRLAEN